MSTGTGYIAGRRLTFDKRSRDGSGKCDAEETGREKDRVYGVIFEIKCSHKRALDKAEGRGKGYELQTVQVITKQRTVLAQTYIATKKERSLRPYNWYKALSSMNFPVAMWSGFEYSSLKKTHTLTVGRKTRRYFLPTNEAPYGKEAPNPIDPLE